MIARWIAVATFAIAALGCGSEDVVIATLDEHEAGGPSGDGGCRSKDDCSITEYCQKTDCAQPSGQCMPRPMTCDDDQRESCGCDGVTYWNDCLRQQNRIVSGSMGICAAGAARCDNPMASDCPPVLLGAASCARLLPPNLLCTPNVSGICYVLAPTCPALGSREVYTSCEDPRICQPECDAIRSGKPHRPMCP